MGTKKVDFERATYVVHLRVCDAACVAAFISGLRMYIKRVVTSEGLRGERQER